MIIIEIYVKLIDPRHSDYGLFSLATSLYVYVSVRGKASRR